MWMDCINRIGWTAIRVGVFISIMALAYSVFDSSAAKIWQWLTSEWSYRTIIAISTILMMAGFAAVFLTWVIAHLFGPKGDGK